MHAYCISSITCFILLINISYGAQTKDLIKVESTYSVGRKNYIKTSENIRINENKRVTTPVKNGNNKSSTNNHSKTRRNKDKNKSEVIDNIFAKINKISKLPHSSNKGATEELKNRLGKALRFLGRRAEKYEDLILKLVKNSANAEKHHFVASNQKRHFVADKNTSINRIPVYVKAHNEPDCGCKCIAKKTCPLVKSLNELKCNNGEKTVSLEKLCDGVYDCRDQSDEEHCASKVIKRLKEAKSVINDAEESYLEKCFQCDAITGIKSRSFKNTLHNQISLLNQYDNHPLLIYTLEGVFKDRIASEKAANEAAVVLSMAALALEGAICVEHLVKVEDYDTSIHRASDTLSHIDVGEVPSYMYSLRWSTASCSCSNYECVRRNCSEACKAICQHKYMLSQFICKPIDNFLRPSVLLDVVCDGKIDCYDETDEEDCNEGNSYSKFQATAHISQALKLVRSKIVSKEYEPVQSDLLSLYSDITSLQQVQDDKPIDLKAIKYLRDLIFKTLGHIYGAMVDTTNNSEQESAIFNFFESLNENLIDALKNSNTGNVPLIPMSNCFCRGTKCGIPNCPSSCARTCIAEPVLTRLVCKGSSKNSSAAISVLCDGRNDCPEGDDEKDCKSKDLCQKHHLIALRTDLSVMVKREEGTLFGEILKLWNSKLTQNLEKAEKLTRPKPAHIRLIASKATADLVSVYSGLGGSVNNEIDLKKLQGFSQKIIDFIKVCGK